MVDRLEIEEKKNIEREKERQKAFNIGGLGQEHPNIYVVDKKDFVRDIVKSKSTSGKAIFCPAGCGNQIINVVKHVEKHFHECPSVVKTCMCCDPSYILRYEDYPCKRKLIL